MGISKSVCSGHTHRTANHPPVGAGGHSPRRPSRGFTLIELLIVVAILGVIAALLIPNMLDALQKARQKRSMAGIQTVGTAMMALLTDVSSAAAAGQVSTVDLGDFDPITAEELEGVLAPLYLQEVPPLDGWKFPYDYYLSSRPSSRHLGVMAIRSRGLDGTAEGDLYTVTSFSPTDYDQDIVWTDGFFVRWPANIQRAKLR